ncbi:MAG: CDP-alcohol phosphatidyltransferase family protein [Cytophagales bacterium]|nr:CDP-alcohol phosphatidyltransferase family protein [Cytophagales bacterium]
MIIRYLYHNIPNIITTCNLVCGCIAIVLIFNGSLLYAACFVFFGAMFDFCDGLVARLLNVKSAIGKDLDSLADMVTFGMVPGFAMYKFMAGMVGTHPFIYTSIAIPILSAWRLAKFNNDPRQSSEFYGLPTPANALFFMSLPVVAVYETFVAEFFMRYIYTVPTLCIIFSILLVSEVRLFSLKIKDFDITNNLYQIILLMSSLVLLVSVKLIAIPLIVILYLILSVIKNYILKK